MISQEFLIYTEGAESNTLKQERNGNSNVNIKMETYDEDVGDWNHEAKNILQMYNGKNKNTCYENNWCENYKSNSDCFSKNERYYAIEEKNKDYEEYTEISDFYRRQVDRNTVTTNNENENGVNISTKGKIIGSPRVNNQPGDVFDNTEKIIQIDRKYVQMYTITSYNVNDILTNTDYSDRNDTFSNCEYVCLEKVNSEANNNSVNNQSKKVEQTRIDNIKVEELLISDIKEEYEEKSWNEKSDASSYIKGRVEIKRTEYLICEQCEKQFYREKHWLNHKCYKCHTCGKIFTHKYQFCRHLLSHKINVFDKNYRHPRLNLNMTKKKYECDQCGKCYDSKTFLHQHIECIHYNLRFSCEKCKAVFVRKDSLAGHMRFCGNDYSESCFVCSKRFYAVRSVSKHLKAAHAIAVVRNKQRSSFKCLGCQVSLTTHKHAVDHVRLSQCTVSHKCPKCLKMFKRRDQLNIHLKGHAGEFSCDICFKRFMAQNSLNSHKKNLHGK